MHNACAWNYVVIDRWQIVGCHYEAEIIFDFWVESGWELTIVVRVSAAVDAILETCDIRNAITLCQGIFLVYNYNHGLLESARHLDLRPILGAWQQFYCQKFESLNFPIRCCKSPSFVLPTNVACLEASFFTIQKKLGFKTRGCIIFYTEALHYSVIPYQIDR